MKKKKIKSFLKTKIFYIKKKKNYYKKISKKIINMSFNIKNKNSLFFFKHNCSKKLKICNFSGYYRGVKKKINRHIINLFLINNFFTNYKNN